jgi:hypothetical protein
MNIRSTGRLAALLPFLFLFGGITLVVFLLNPLLFSWGVDVRVLQVSNALLFLVALFSTGWMGKSFRQPGGQALLKALYGGFMIRFFILAISAFIYILVKRKQVNVPGLAGAAFFYVLYTVIEIRALRTHFKSDPKHG